jgi:hypothetical protein
VYKILTEAGIGVPHHIVVNRDGLEPGEDPPGFIQEVCVCNYFLGGEGRLAYVWQPHCRESVRVGWGGGVAGGGGLSWWLGALW